MSGLPIDLQKLPPSALDVLRFLGTLKDGAASEEIMDGAGLSERAFGKAIRRLVTRYYVEMPVQGYYKLTGSGVEAVQILREFDGVPLEDGALSKDSDTDDQSDDVTPPEPAASEPAPIPDHAVEVPVVPEMSAAPEASVPSAPSLPALPELAVPAVSMPLPALEAPVALEVEVPSVPSAAPEDQGRYHQRRVSIFLPRALVAHSASRMRFGFDRPRAQGNPLLANVHTVVRMSAQGCDIDVAEHAIEVPPRGPAGPVDFRITPHQIGTVRIQIEVFQLLDAGQRKAVGGMFFDLPAAQFPTPESAEFQTLATTLRMHPGAR